MGQVLSRMLSRNMLAEIFMISYMSRRGVTPYTLDLLPGGSLGYSDDPAVVRHKFRQGLKRQTMIDRALRQIQRGEVPRCVSPCMIREFNEAGQATAKDVLDRQVREYTWKDENRKRASSRASRVGFGALERLVSDTGKKDSVPFVSLGVSSEEIVAFDVVPDQKLKEPLRGSQREKRARSRPEPRTRRVAAQQKRQSMSVTQVMSEPPPHLLTPLMRETPSCVTIERIQLGSAKKKVWPPREVLRNVLKDPKTRPTSFFLARFRLSPDSEFVEVDYRFNKATGNHSFQMTGSLEKLLKGDALTRYLADLENNNCVEDKDVFFSNFPTFFNTLDCRIWWNGYAAFVEGNLATRMRLNALVMDPPTLVFDMSGVRHIRASLNDQRLSFVGTNNERGEGEVLPGNPASIDKVFIIRARTEQDLRQVNIGQIEGTALVSLILPSLSGIPVRTKCSSIAMSKVPSSTKSDASMTRAVPTGIMK